MGCSYSSATDFFVVLDRSQVPSCSELSIKSEQFYFWLLV